MYKRHPQTGNVRELYIREHYVIREIGENFVSRKFPSIDIYRISMFQVHGMYVCMYVCIWQDGGAVGFVDFTKLLFALSSLAQLFNRVRSIPEHFFVILSQRKACAGRFRKETAGKRTGPITRWPLRRLLFTRLEIVFVTISPFTKRTKVAQNVFQEG